MRPISCAVLLWLLLCGAAFAQSQGIYVFTPLGYQQLTSLSGATSLTVPQAAKIAEICVETQPVRYRDDGSAPSSTVGMPVAAGVCFQYSGNLNAIQFIQQAASATVDVLYYR